MGGELMVESSPGYGSTFSFAITFGTIETSDDTSDSRVNMLEKPLFDGLVLICDDNTMNQEVICEHLANIGLLTVVADNGRIGVEKVLERMNKGEQPFDLILMDIFMPIMDGIEAAVKIGALNTGSPILAMTANVMASELENYRRHGFLDCLGKPYTSQDLWRILLKYLTPVSSDLVDEDEYTQENDELLNKLRASFVKKNQSIYMDIIEAIADGDTKYAHRLAHTLKGNAGQIGETGLQKIAEAVESTLKDGTLSMTIDNFAVLETELASVLKKLKPMAEMAESREETPPLDLEEIISLFEKLEPMLEKRDSGCMSLLAEIHAVPGAEELARHIEEVDFRGALQTLRELMNKYK
jgi:CheY-like chemotaxis protein